MELYEVTWEFVVQLGIDTDRDIQTLNRLIDGSLYDETYDNEDSTTCSARAVENSRTGRAEVIFTFRSSKGPTLPPDWLRKMKCRSVSFTIEGIQKDEGRLFDQTETVADVLRDDELITYGTWTARSYAALEQRYLGVVQDIAQGR